MLTLFQIPSKRLSKEPGAEKDEFDVMLDDKEMNKSLSERIGVSKEVLKKKRTKGSGGASGGASKKKKGKDPWESDAESGISIENLVKMVQKQDGGHYVQFSNGPPSHVSRLSLTILHVDKIVICL